MLKTKFNKSFPIFQLPQKTPKIKIKIKTPLWTGDIDSKSDLLRPTSIMGSLRWWTEAILRGIDKFACDPTGDDRCPKENDKKIRLYCPSCLIFGATGIRRLFRLEINGGTKVYDGGLINIKPEDRKRGWYLGSGLIGELELNIIPLDKNFDESLVLVPLAIASNFGGISAKTQHGYGVIEFENEVELKFENFQNALNKILDEGRLKNLGIQERNGTNDTLPNIKDMFFVKVQFEVDNDDWWKEADGIKQISKDPRMIDWINTKSVPISPAIKNWLRFGDGGKLWKTDNQNQDAGIENWLFGTTSNNKSASKINISCAYKINDTTWEFRIWGWIPKNENPKGFDRNKFLNDLEQELSNGSFLKSLLGNYTNKKIIWREFESSRDKITPNESDIHNYLQSLLKHKLEHKGDT